MAMIGMLNGTPKVASVSKDPAFVALKEKVATIPTFAGRLKMLKADDGTLVTGVSDDSHRRILIRIEVEDFCEREGLHPEVACVVLAALDGVPDDSIYGVLVPEGASVQQLCDTDMTTEEAVAAVAGRDKDAAGILATGISSVVPAKYSAYKTRLWSNFKNRLGDSLSPLHNPLIAGVTPYILAGLVALILLRRAMK